MFPMQGASIPGRGTKIPHTPQHDLKIIIKIIVIIIIIKEVYHTDEKNRP